MKRFYAAFVLLLTVSTGLLSEEKLNLETAVAAAFKNNSMYKIAVEQTRESEAKVNQVWGMLWPSLATDASWTKMHADEKAGSASKLDHQTTINIVNMQFAINPGVFYNSLRSAQSGYEASELYLRKVRADINKATIDIYYSVILAKETLRMREESAKALGENLKTVKMGYEKGILPKLQYLSAQVEYSNAQTQVINSKSDYESAMNTLNIHIGNELETPISLTFDILNFNNKELESLMENGENEERFVNRLIAESLKNRPELIQKKYTKEAMEYAAKAESSIYFWPSFFVNGKYTTTQTAYKNLDSGSSPESTGNPQTDLMIQQITAAMTTTPSEKWLPSWSVSVGASYKWGALAPWDSSHAKKDQFESKATQADLELEAFVKTVKLDVKRNYLKMKAARNSIMTQKDNVITAKENMKASEIQFKNGLIDNTKYIDSNVKLIAAETMLIQAYHSYHTAKAELNNVIGTNFFNM